MRLLRRLTESSLLRREAFLLNSPRMRSHMTSREFKLVRSWASALALGFAAPRSAALAVATLVVAALGITATACGSGAPAGAKEADSTSSSCLDSAGPSSLCETLVGHFTRCTETTTSKQHLNEDCRATWGDFSSRANGCFVQRLADCLSGPCESVNSERCFWEATVASDPESFDAASGKACRESGDCDGVADGWMAQCTQRFEACSADGDLCSSAVSLQRRFRGDVDACLAEECGSLEDCVYAAMGH